MRRVLLLALGLLTASRAALGAPQLVLELDPEPSEHPPAVHALTPRLWVVGSDLFELDPERGEARFVRQLGFTVASSSNRYPAVCLGEIAVTAARVPGFGVLGVVRSDGTAAGTYPIGSFELYGYTDRVETIAVLDGQAYLRARDPTAGAVLATDGRRTAEVRLFADPDVYPRLFSGNIFAAAGYLWLSTGREDGTLWRATGEPGSAVPVMPFGGEPDDLPAVIEVEDRVLATDGSSLFAIEPTSLARERLASPVSTSPVPAPGGGHAWFLRGQELWRTDGTASGTAKVAEGFAPRDRQRSVLVAGPAVFGADSERLGVVGWNERVGRAHVDGFPFDRDRHLALAEALVGLRAVRREGRRVEEVLRVDARSLEVEVVGEVESAQLFPDGAGGAWVVSSTTSGPRLQRLGADGRPADGVELTDEGGIQPFDVSLFQRLFVEDLHGITASGALFVGRNRDLSIVEVATGSVAERVELAWSSDVPVDPRGAFYARSTEAPTDANGTELWRHDAELGSARRLGAWPRRILRFGASRGGLYFFTSDGYLADEEAWWTDGTPEGTRRVDLGLAYGQGARLFHPIVAPIEAWVHGETERWVRETPSGPQTLLEVNELPPGPSRFVRAGSARYQVSADWQEPVDRRRLRVYRLQADSATPIEQVYESGPSGRGPSCGFHMPYEATLLSAEEGLFALGPELVRVDAAGVRGARAPCWVQDLLPFEDGALFTSFTPERGLELWVWQPGLPPRIVRDIAPGPASSRPSALTRVGARAVFYAWHPSLGRELWVTDGTEAGTYPVTDLVPGPRDGVHRRAGIAAGPEHVVFFGLDRAHGAEPWRLPIAELDVRVEIPPAPEPDDPPGDAPADPLAPSPGALEPGGCGCRTAAEGWPGDLLWLAVPLGPIFWRHRRRHRTDA